MNIDNKIFKNNITGKTVKVISSFEDIAILENKQKMSVKDLLDPNKYTEEIDPIAFFNNQNAYNDLANKIKNINTNDIVDETGGVTIKMDDKFIPPTNESAIIETTEEYEREKLMKKYGAQPDINSDVSKQQEAFDKLLNEEQTNVSPQKNQPDDNVTRIEVNRNEHKEVSREYVEAQTKPEDPIITMFKNVKRNVDFNVSLDFTDKIPRLDFIEMMEDSYNTSLIEFLADEFTNKLLKDPNIIKNLFKTEIEKLVYLNNIPPVGLDLVKENEMSDISDDINDNFDDNQYNDNIYPENIKKEAIEVAEALQDHVNNGGSLSKNIIDFDDEVIEEEPELIDFDDVVMEEEQEEILLDKKIINKMTAKEKIIYINSLNSISNIDEIVEDEERKTVLSAAKKRISELK